MNKALHRKNQAGMTLMEVILAVAIFAAVIGVSAQALASFYLSMDMQEQRIEGLQSCRAVMSGLRERRESFETDFPNSLIAFVNANNASGWQSFLANNADHEELRGHSLEVTLMDMDGSALSGPTAPVQVFVRATWRDRRDRPMSAALVTVFNNQ